MLTYTKMIELPTYLERYRYLKIGGAIGEETFGYDRYLNQVLYQCREWKEVRRHVILRDNGCDLGVEGYDIMSNMIVHHMNPITKQQILNRDPIIFDPEYLVLTQLATHNAIHYGDESLLCIAPTERRPNDTIPWRR